MGVCQGTLKKISDNQLSGGYSKRFLKDMFGVSAAPDNGFTIGTTAHKFDQLAPKYTKGVSISGVQRKLLMDLDGDRLIPVAKGGRYIVKPAPPNLPYLSENEHAMMSLARLVGFQVAHCTVLPFEDGELGFVVKRFDFMPDGRRMFIEDGASICNVHPKNKGSDALSYESTLMKMYEAAGKKMPVLLNGFRQVLFAYLIGNNDLHLKNLSMYRSPDSRSTTMMDFTPVYDVLSVFPYPDYNGDYLTLNLLQSEVDGDFSSAYEAYGYYTKHDFIRLAANIGLNEKAATTFVSRLTSNVEKHLDHCLSASELPSDMVDILQTKIMGRLDYMRRNPIRKQ